MSARENLNRQLLRHKNLLANLSRQNRELFFKEVKGSSLNLSISYFAKAAFRKDSSDQFDPLSFSNAKMAKFLEGAEYNLHEHFQMDSISDADEVVRLNRKLDRIRLADDKFQREFGISGAWLLGPFLCWRSSAQDSIDDLIVSPLFKVPINLRKNKKKNLCLIAEEDGLRFNPSLCLALRQTSGAVISDSQVFKNFSEAISYLKQELNKVDKDFKDAESSIRTVPNRPSKQKIIRDEDGEIVERIKVDFESQLSEQEKLIYGTVTASKFLLIDAVYIDQLNASRAVLIGDYEGIIEAEVPHPILSELFNGASINEDRTSVRDDFKKLDSYKERYNHFVVDIDSTQHRAIDKAVSARAIVIQGPPGTGKSQTIVNLIANYLAKGQRVLFVAEKRPALDVVFNRMRTAGIDSQAVLIHGSSLNKSELYKSFLELADAVPDSTDEQSWNTVSDSLDRIKMQLNGYAEEIARTHNPSNEASAEVIFRASESDGRLFDPTIAEKFGRMSRRELESLKIELSGLEQLAEDLPNFSESPWLNRKPTTIRTTSLEYSLRTVANRIREANVHYMRNSERFSSLTGQEPNTKIVESIEAIPQAVQLSVEYSALWDKSKSQVEKTIEALREQLRDIAVQLQQLHRNFESVKAKPVGLEPDSRVLALAEYYSMDRGISDWFTAAFWTNRKTRQELCPAWDGTARQFSDHVKYLDCLKRLQTLSSAFHASMRVDQMNHSELLIRLEIESAGLNKLSTFFKSAELHLPDQMKAAVNNSLREYNEAVLAIVEVQEIWKTITILRAEVDDAYEILQSYLEVVPPKGSIDACLATVEQLQETVDHLEYIDRFDVHLARIEASINQTSLKKTIIDRLSNSGASWAEVLEASVAHYWKDFVMSESPRVRAFERDHHSQVNTEFNELAKEHKAKAKAAILNSFAKRWTDKSIANRSGVPLLARESSKSRAVLSPREIMERGALSTMMQLKPCWLMSPLSISQMLPLVDSLFDVIIFDEASQVKVEDAIPSIYRAKTMIVVGDDKQMPPTAFFSGSGEEDGDEDLEEIAPSVLDLALQIYPAELLEWHYRSRAEALIAFSNRAFYGGRLIAAPNPSVLTAGKPIEHRIVDDAFFTSKLGNVVEAQEVIDHLIKLLQENPNRSYGVIAMGMSQSKTLNEVLERRKESDPRLRQLIEAAENFEQNDADAGLFIKNLENVQGDERDVILMSVGYAPAAPDKKLRIGFGPLSSKGGGRRLNVAVTRAKSKMIVFTSFQPVLLPTDEETFSRNPDLCTFGRYLQYAEAVSNDQVDRALSILRSFPMSGVVTARKSSRFALDVKRRLESNGHVVSAEVGSSGFFLDLAIYHKASNTQFALGIECDGAIFHSTPYARDRDKIRQELLESRGWKIIRIWSQDWSKDWRAEILRIETALKLATAGNAVDLIPDTAEIERQQSVSELTPIAFGK